MEKIVKLLAQGAMRKSDWQNNRGENVTIKSVELSLSDGIDSFVAEATDKLAEQITEHPLRNDCFYGVSVRLSIRYWKAKDQSGAEVTRSATTLRVVNIVGL